MSHGLRRWVLLGAAVCSAAALAADQKRLGLGVYLPGTIESRDKQSEFAQALAAQLTSLLGRPVAAFPFARHEDFAKAATDGTLDFAVSEALVLAQARGDYTPIATCQVGERAATRWAVVAERQSVVSKLAGKRLALVKGPGNTDREFVSNIVFAGELSREHFRLVFVPTTDSALRAIEAKKADAALVQAEHVPANLKVLYRSGWVSGAVLVNLRANEAELRAAVAKLSPIAPFAKFPPAAADEVGQLRRRLARAPGAKLPLISTSPIHRPDASALAPFKAANVKFPAFVEFVEVSKDQPND